MTYIAIEYINTPLIHSQYNKTILLKYNVHYAIKSLGCPVFEVISSNNYTYGKLTRTLGVSTMSRTWTHDESGGEVPVRKT